MAAEPPETARAFGEQARTRGRTAHSRVDGVGLVSFRFICMTLSDFCLAFPERNPRKRAPNFEPTTQIDSARSDNAAKPRTPAGPHAAARGADTRPQL